MDRDVEEDSFQWWNKLQLLTYNKDQLTIEGVNWTQVSQDRG